ncbi:hypothetical protein BJF84_00115 [Rhodococcus sp. CUA-806]|nr:hypothetical protein BJF84_00115 [Rhodococcus sp. CUA-806]
MLEPHIYTPPLSEDFTTNFTDHDIETVNALYFPPGQQLEEFQIWLLRRIFETFPPGWPEEHLRGKLRWSQGCLVMLPRQASKSTIAGAAEFISLLKAANRRNITKMGVVATTTTQAEAVFERVALPFLQNEALKKRFSVNFQQRTIRPKDRGISAYFRSFATDRAIKLQGISFDAEGGVAATVDEAHLLDAEVYEAMSTGKQVHDNTIILITTTAGQRFPTCFTSSKTWENAL